MAKLIHKSQVINYLNLSEEFLESAKENLDKKRFNVAAFNSIQSIINSNDGLTIYFLGKRGTRSHNEAMLLHMDVVKMISDSSGKKILRDALEKRNEAGYLGKLLGKKDAEKLVKNASLFFKWVHTLVL